MLTVAPSLLVLLSLAVPRPAVAPGSPEGPDPAPLASAPAEDPPSDAALRERWEKLDAEGQAEVAEWFRAEVQWLDTFQLRLVRHVLDQEERDAGFWPVAGDPPVFDPKVEAPRAPTPRRPLDASSSRARREIEKLAPPARRRVSAWSYDWARRTVVRTGDDRSDTALFENALAGIPPDLDLAEALLLMQLDRGDEQEAFAAFAHAYTDRSGRVYPLTLYDAWSSGEEIEMPDIDVLGLYHFFGGARGDYTAPIPNSAHPKLYGRLGDRLRAAKRYREVREAAARTYLDGRPVLPAGYDANLDRFHALWERHSSEIAPLAEQLPDAERWEEFLSDWVERCANGSECHASGTNRRHTLERDGAAVRALLARILAQVE